MDGEQTGMLGRWALVEFQIENCRIEPIGFNVPAHPLDLNKHRTDFYKYFISKSFYLICQHIPILVRIVNNSYRQLT